MAAGRPEPRLLPGRRARHCKHQGFGHAGPDPPQPPRRTGVPHYTVCTLGGCCRRTRPAHSLGIVGRPALIILVHTKRLGPCSQSCALMQHVAEQVMCEQETMRFILSWQQAQRLPKITELSAGCASPAARKTRRGIDTPMSGKARCSQTPGSQWLSQSGAATHGQGNPTQD